MSQNSLSEGSLVLRLEFSIADAVQQRGLLPVIGAAVIAWWNRPRLPEYLPDHIRADIGLPPADQWPHWVNVPIYPINPNDPDPLRRRGM